MRTERRVPVHLIFAGVYVLLAVVTSVPTGSASKASLLGYEALCSFTPISTLMLLALGGLHVFLHRRTLHRHTAQQQALSSRR